MNHDRDTTRSDEALFADFLAGDEAMLATLIHRYERPLYGYLLHLTGESTLAAEVFQDTFVRAWQKRATFTPGRPFKPWLYQVALNLTRDRLRARRPTTPLDALALPPNDPRPSPAAAAATADWQAAVANAVATLPLAQREVFLLRTRDEADYATIAHIVGRRVATVRSDMFRAVQQVRQWLAQHGDLP